MTREELERAKTYAQNWINKQGPPFDIEIDAESTTYSEGEDCCWLKAWVFVPREAYNDDETGSEMVPGG